MGFCYRNNEGNCKDWSYFKLNKGQYLPHYWSDNDLKGIVVYRVYSIENKVSLEITTTGTVKGLLKDCLKTVKGLLKNC